MKNYVRKALLFSGLISVLYIGMYAVLLCAECNMIEMDGGYVFPAKNIAMSILDKVIIGVLIAFIPYELILSKVSAIFTFVFMKNKKKQVFYTTIVLVIINFLLGILVSFLRERTPFYLQSANRRFEYLVLFFVCLNIGIIIYSREIQNKALRLIIRNLVNLLNGVIVYAITRTMGQALIVIFSMTVFVVIFDRINDKKFILRDCIVTSVVGIGAVVGGLFAKGYHNLEKVDEYSKIFYNPFERTLQYLGVGYLVLLIIMVLLTAAVLICSVKFMYKKNQVRSGLLLAAVILYICGFMYSILAMTGFPCSEVNLINNSVHIVVWVLVVRCFVVIPVPKREEDALSEEDISEDPEIEFLMDEVHHLLKKQNLILEYLMTIDNRLERLELSQKAGSEEYEKLKAEIEDDRETLAKHNIPLNKHEFSARLKEIYDKKNNKE